MLSIGGITIGERRFQNNIHLYNCFGYQNSYRQFILNGGNVLAWVFLFYKIFVHMISLWALYFYTETFHYQEFPWKWKIFSINFDVQNYTHQFKFIFDKQNDK